MRNLYSVNKGQAAIIALTRAMRDTTGNTPQFPGIFPDQIAPVVANKPSGIRELAMLRFFRSPRTVGLRAGANARHYRNDNRNKNCDNLCLRKCPHWSQ